MTLFNTLICLIGFLMGVYTFAKHLKAFSANTNTPAVKAWLVSVGTLCWSVWLYASLNEPIMSSTNMVGRVLIFVFWVGVLLETQKYCIKFKRLLKPTQY